MESTSWRPPWGPCWPSLGYRRLVDDQLVSGSVGTKAPARVNRKRQEMTNLRSLLSELDTLEQMTGHIKNCELTFAKTTTPTTYSDDSSDRY